MYCKNKNYLHYVKKKKKLNECIILVKYKLYLRNDSRRLIYTKIVNK